MTVARHYIMIAKEGMGTDLEAALKTLAEAVRGLPGCEGVDMLRDIDQESRFVFIEKWADVEAHKAAGPMLDKGILAPMRAALGGPPDGSYLTYISAP